MLYRKLFANNTFSTNTILRYLSTDKNVLLQESQSKTPIKKYIPRRSMMYVPGSDERKIKKIPGLNVDSVCLDCEDGVASNKKEEARKLIRHTLDNLGTMNFGRTEVTARVNSVDSGLCAADLEEILAAKNLPSAIHLPKVETLDQIKWFLDKTSTIFKQRNQELSQKINLIIFVESAMALLSLVDLTRGAIKLCENSAFVPDALVFGSDDYCAGIGISRTNEAQEIQFARQYVVTVAKAFNLQAIDIVYTDFKDTQGFVKQALAGAAMGYTGKQLIHPSQISPCQEAFSPTPEKIEWAQELIKAFEEHQQSGKGAFLFRNSMIDMPLLLQASHIVDLANTLGTRDKT